MSDFKERVKNEQNELSAKIINLSIFVLSDAFLDLHRSECRRLVTQLAIMNAYESILNDRLHSNFGAD